MKKSTVVFCMIACAIPFASFGASPQAAKELHETNCVSCHGTEVYTRSDRKVTTASGLEHQVRRCELALGLKWFDDEISAVSQYLNENYYQFKP